MTQSPSPQPYPPYPYPQYGYPMADPLAPARKGGLLLIILGSVGLLFGGCIAASAAVFSRGEIQLPADHPMTQMDAQMVTLTIYIFAGLIGAAALAMIVLGIFARRGSGVACILGVVLCGLLSLLLLLQIIGAIGAGPQGLIVLPIVAVGVALLGLAIAWLVKGARAAFAAPRMQPMSPYGYPQAGYYPQQQPYGQPLQGYYAPPPQQANPQQPPPSDRPQ